MNVLNHLEGNFLIGGVGVGIGLATKKIFKKETIPVGSVKHALISFSVITLSTYIAKTIYLNYEMRKLGFKKVENEGFIGPLPHDSYYPYVPDWIET